MALLAVGALTSETRPLAAARPSLETAHFYPGRYYPGVIDSLDADLVRVLPGEVSPELILHLPEAGGTLSGQVLGQVGTVPQPLEGVVVEALVSGFRVATLSGENGSYTLAGVPAGEVRVRFSTDDSRSRERRYLAAYYPGCTDAPPGCSDSSLAQVLSLADGEALRLEPALLDRSAVLGGQIRAPGSEEPLRGIAIHVLAGIDGRVWWLKSDSEGRYVLGGLPAGEYRILAASDGTPFVPEYFGGARTLDLAEAVIVAAGEERSDLDIIPDRGGSISGQVRSEGTGTVLPDARVEATDLATGRLYLGMTNQFGLYEIVGLPTGRYRVYVPLILEYFPNTFFEDEARPIQVTEPNPASQIDFVGRPGGDCMLSPEGAVIIEGVVEADFSEMPSAIVRAYSQTDTVELEVTEAGPYSIPCVEAGTYQVVMLPEGIYRKQYYSMVDFPWQAIIFTLGPGDSARAVNFTPRLAATLRGQVLDAESLVPVPDCAIRVLEMEGAGRATGRTDAQGRFEVSLLPDGTGLPAGLYRVEAESTLVPDPGVTPVLQPRLEARTAGPGRILVEWRLEAGFRWQYRLDRRNPDGTEVELAEGEYGPGSLASGGILDEVESREAVRYRLTARLDGEPDTFTTWSDPIAPAWPEAAGESFLVWPVPWNGRGLLRFQATDEMVPRVRSGGRLRIFGAGGREVVSLSWPEGTHYLAWDGRNSEARPVPSGIFLFRFTDADGQGTEGGTILIQR